ncbi:MAG: uroporphyrinogen decarboxylase [Gemmatimonadetes bacterium]|uniref:Uroporphyrinogen decarboxylase n=1 Tax=Candidatus Kutchimonas denitrificans TaxID=3056748 RepID=A0AAE5CB23_9BACT|nr:uroporphyrinogen decarboxylase [Gemmatimonadota bacterium]NIR74013.1 uroporphyrinogen decarboxylase [Candidatus Kutchimonas denitrificans]NIS03002.1 uroporphyrinogen decarboxylase [Gemmatimonadota bacterium]NIT68719.1 uroporphyrinogen decarboxylase [Gemmatimonadota bacterium]NIU53300.1 uroporphyrinogen decarboxylase [Gemmatimonadota bacterium]
MDREYPFLRACRREPVSRVPVWLMRQAGRYMPEYRALREKHTILELCRTPELAAEVTLQPIDRFDLDAAIIFADILLPLEPLGVGFHFEKGEGPVIERPVRTAADVKALQKFDPTVGLDYVLEAIKIVRSKLEGRAPLIGFAGAPFTLASYMIEGGGSKNYLEMKSFMYRQPDAWHELMRRVREMTRDYLAAQIEAGAQAVQMFDSWVGCLSPEDYREYVLPHSAWVFEGLASYDVPRIHFGTNTATLLEAMKEVDSEVIGVDWRLPIDVARRIIGSDFAVQGNLDPALLMAPPELLVKRVGEILAAADAKNGYIFNLGHGVLPPTPMESVDAVIETVHGW